MTLPTTAARIFDARPRTRDTSVYRVKVIPAGDVHVVTGLPAVIELHRWAFPKGGRVEAEFVEPELPFGEVRPT